MFPPKNNASPTSVSILHKCDYNIQSSQLAHAILEFQFYISAIITVDKSYFGLHTLFVSILHKCDYNVISNV